MRRAAVLLIAGVALTGCASTESGSTQSPALVTQTEVAQTTSVAPQPPQTFKGAGSENLGTIAVTVPSTLHWRCGSCLVFAVAAAGGTNTIEVDTQNRTSGVTAVEPGVYHSVDITADEGEGNSGWTVTVTAGQ